MDAYPKALQPIVKEFVEETVQDFTDTMKEIVMPKEYLGSFPEAIKGAAVLIKGERRLQLLCNDIFAF